MLALINAFIFIAVRFDLNDISDFFDNSPQTSDGTGFPKKLFGDNPLQFERAGSMLAMSTDSRLYLIGENGGTVVSSPHSYTRPVIFCTNSRVLTYDQGGNSFRVDTGKGTAFEQEMANEIICGTMSPNGTAAIATVEERYASSVTVFNTQNKQVFKWYSSDYQITSLALTDGGQLAVSCIGAKEGAILSTVTLLNINEGENQEERSASFSDLMILSVTYKNNGALCVIGDTKMVMLSGNAEVQAEHAYGKTISDFSDLSGDYTVVVLSSSEHSTASEVVLLNNSAEKVGSYQHDQAIKWAEASGGTVTLLTDREILRLDAHMNVTQQHSVRSDAKRTVTIGSTVYVLGLGEISVAGN